MPVRHQPEMGDKIRGTETITAVMETVAAITTWEPEDGVALLTMLEAVVEVKLVTDHPIMVLPQVAVDLPLPLTMLVLVLQKHEFQSNFLITGF